MAKSTRAKTPSGTDVPLVPAPISVGSAVAESPTISADGRTPTQRLLEKARRQYRTVTQAEARLRRDMLADRKFRLGTIGDQHLQWPDHIFMERVRDKRPVVTINRTAGYVDMARNMGDTANLRIKYNPVDDQADPAVANVLSGLARNVEENSQAEDVYSTTGDAQCEMGRGYFWILTEYQSDDSFSQRAKLKRILNPLRVKVDPAAQEKDQHDAEYSFYDTDLDVDTWKERFGANGTKEPPTTADVVWADGEGDQSGEWFPSEGKIAVKHWFCAEYEPDRLYELQDGRTLRQDALTNEVMRLLHKAAADTNGGPVVDLSAKAITAATEAFIETQVKRQRSISVRVIKWRVIDAVYIHEETTWQTPWQPLIPMVGHESDLNGEREVRGVVRDQYGSQKAYNVQVSSMLELTNDMPKAPYIGYRGVFGKQNTPGNKAWATAGSKRHSYLEAEIVEGPNGQILPLPQRNWMNAPIGAIAQTLAQADEDMKATARMHDATMGEKGPQESGKAIQARQRQDEMSSSHFTRNRRSAIASAGRQLLHIFRNIYDVATVVRIVGEDDQKQKVMVFTGEENDPRAEHNLAVDPGTGQPIPFELPKGVKGIYDLGVGEYDVEVSAAPQPGSRRQEEVALMSEFMRSLPPEYMVNFMDLLFKLLDSPVGRQMGERAGKLLRPDLKDQSDADGGPPAPPPEMMQKMQQIQEREGDLMSALKDAQETIKSKKLELASKESIETMKRYIELVRLLVTEDKADQRLLLQTEVDRITSFMASAEARIAQAEAPSASPELA